MVWTAPERYSGGRYTAKEYADQLGTRLHPITETLLASNDEDNVAAHRAETGLNHGIWLTQSIQFDLIGHEVEADLANCNTSVVT
jgi:hypothetical protein